MVGQQPQFDGVVLGLELAQAGVPLGDGGHRRGISLLLLRRRRHVPAKRAARARLLSTGHGRMTGGNLTSGQARLC